MSYEELEVLYPWFDLFLELFKGLAPTIVAVLAIIINNSIATKRDRDNSKRNKLQKINDAKVSVLNAMLEKYIELSQLFWVCGTHLILYLSHTDNGKKEREFEAFEQNQYRFQFKAQEIHDYYTSMMKQYDFGIGCHATLTDVTNFSEALNNIGEKYINVLESENDLERDVVLDEARDEILEATIEVKAWTNVIMVNISKKIKELYE